LGGGIEIIIHDPVLGVVFYFIEPPQNGKGYQIVRDTGSCLNCHGTRRTESVPGLTVRSVPTDADGHLLLSLGTMRTDYRSPIEQRWAGYYVTGSSSLPHLGNRIFSASDHLKAEDTSPPIRSLEDKIDVSRYLRGTSDIVALMVLEHQCFIHNLFTNASMEFRRVRWLEESVSTDPASSRMGRIAEEKARVIVDAMLFKHEAAIGEGGVDGDDAFQEAFVSRFPKTKGGESLADFHLGSRLFKNRCSYMIHSQAFQALPQPVRTAVFRELRARLTGGSDCEWIPRSECERIMEILTETVPGFKDA